MKIALIYTSHEGQTEKIMTRIQSHMEPHYQCDKIKLTENPHVYLMGYDAVIIGSSIRYGFYHQHIRHFIQKNYQALEAMPNAFFGINLVARKPNKNTPETNGYTRKFLAHLPWKPKLVGVFAGALHYPKYTWYDRCLIRFIMWLGSGETDTRKPLIEYTDWVKVDEFAKQFKTEWLMGTQRMSFDEDSEAV